VQSIRPAWRIGRHVTFAHPQNLSEFFPSGRKVAVQRFQARQGCATLNLSYDQHLYQP
jgi:hypothetical protein